MSKPAAATVKKARYRGPVFVHEWPLKVTGGDRRQLNIVFRFATNLYNAVLQDCLSQAEALRASHEWQATLSLPKGPARNSAFTQMVAAAGLDKAALEKLARGHRQRCAIRDHLDDHLCQKLAERVFDGIDKYLFYKRGRPRFKALAAMDSLEGKSNLQSLRWRNGIVHYGKLKLKPIFDRKDRDGVEAHAVATAGGDGSGISFVRIVRRRLRGSTCFFVQLVLRGRPLVKKRHQKELRQGLVGLDLNVAIVAASGDTESCLEELCPGAVLDAQRIARLQRQVDRSRRATNPELFGKSGKPKPGSKGKFKQSKNGTRLARKLANAHRVAAGTRKTEQGQLANRLLKLGDRFQAEKVTVKGWQKLFGKSIASRAPSAFETRVARKAENAGGGLSRFATRTTALSQVCICGGKRKKSLGQRWHRCDCGVVAQRDLLVSYLARHVDVEKNVLDVPKAKAGWQAAEGQLRDAASRAKQVASAKALLGHQVPSSLGFGQGQSHSHPSWKSGTSRVTTRAGKGLLACGTPAAEARPLA